MVLEDGTARHAATDPFRSFIVQAPAGSGKTELLTQRFLRLLSIVQAPEQIIALTFTRKAASEMKTRILLALMDAKTNTAIHTAHQETTRNYAKSALARSKELGWQLLENPARLKIMTIDSLSGALTHAVPLLDRDIPFAKLSNLPQLHYQKAVRACLQYVLKEKKWQPQISLILEHLDNRQDMLIDLLVFLLSRREQWLQNIYAAKTKTKEDFEAVLRYLERHEIERFMVATPRVYWEELHHLCQQMANIASESPSLRATAPSLRATAKQSSDLIARSQGHWIAQLSSQRRGWNSFKDLNRDIAMGLANLLLTKDNQLRKSFDHHIGLKKDTCPPALYAELKASSKALLESLSSNKDFIRALQNMKNLPNPVFADSQWQVLQALLDLLPLLTAHLHLVFSEHSEIDFTGIAQQALLALGNEEEPTDLALFLDHSIHHVLIDEFQDTSLQQFQLIEKLVQAWQPDESKTLFIVGDPMQSIYRFRQAEVGLFLKAQLQGIGPVRLKTLKLSCNFRATKALVHWVNQQFADIFPKMDDMESGAISFHPSIAVKEAPETHHAVQADAFTTTKKEAEALLELVRKELEQHPNESIAILVRSRNQLAEIVPLLRHHAIPFQGLEIEKLSTLSHLKDIWSLTKALLLPGERLAWLAFLRSPWCGIQLADLHELANFDKNKSLYFALSQLDLIENISEDGRGRATYIYQIMHQALNRRHQQPLTEWILDVLKQLHKDKILSPAQESDLEQFFLLMTKFTTEDQIFNMQAFEKEFETLYSERVTPSNLQIMTIHKSKGLEFDAVILPGLGSLSKNKDKPLLRWLHLTSREEEKLILSPIQARDQQKCPLYEFIGSKNLEKEQYEQQRLLYVAVTRAKKRLYLLDGHNKIYENSLRALLKQVQFVTHEEENKEIKVAPQIVLPELNRLGLRFYQTPALPYKETNPCESFPNFMHHPMRLIGIAAHELLQWICDKHPAKDEIFPWNMVENRLKSVGITGNFLQTALKELKTQIETMLSDPIGAWICKQHEEEHNEYELLVKEKEEIVTRIIDRSFIEKGIRWIIDFKTGKDASLSENEHRKQVNHYAKILSQHPKSYPIRCGLFYLSDSRWVVWE